MSSSIKTAVVTGGSRGIGFGIASALAREGYNLVISGTRAEADEAVAALRAICASAAGASAEGSVDVAAPAAGSVDVAAPAAGSAPAEVLYVSADNSSREGRESVLDAALGAFGRLDLLVNNAGIAPRVRADLLETTEESYDSVVDTNARSTFFMCQSAAKRMIALRGSVDNFEPKIINISSVSAFAVSRNRGEYCVSKAAISMVTQLFAERLADEGILVYEIQPGIIATDMTAKVKDKYDGLIGGGLTPIKRWGYPEDIGKAVGAIASGAFPFSTGQVFFVDGGFHIRAL